jgi:hypothetical protein
MTHDTNKTPRIRLLTTGAIACAIACAIALATSASAYTLKTTDDGATYHWDTLHIYLEVEDDTWNDSAARTAIEDAKNAWLNNPSNFWMSVREDDDGWALGNGENEVAYTDSAAVLCGVGCTWTYVEVPTGEIQETDVYMDIDNNWTASHVKSDRWEYGGTDRPAEATLIHEFGHVIGLGHEPDHYNIMGESWTHVHVNGSTANSYVGECAGAGAMALYGEWGYIEDLGVTHWRQEGAHPGDYADHHRTRMWSGIFDEMTPDGWATEPTYDVDAGDYYIVEVTMENNGGNRQCGELAVVLSTNDYITTWDTEIRRLSSRCYSPDRPSSAYYGVTIPADTAPGTYWIGVIYDVEDVVDEVREDNNATYLAELHVG